MISLYASSIEVSIRQCRSPPRSLSSCRASEAVVPSERRAAGVALTIAHFSPPHHGPEDTRRVTAPSTSTRVRSPCENDLTVYPILVVRSRCVKQGRPLLAYAAQSPGAVLGCYAAAPTRRGGLIVVGRVWSATRGSFVPLFARRGNRLHAHPALELREIDGQDRGRPDRD